VSLSKSVIGLTITMARITGAMGIDGSGYQDIGRGVITTRFGSMGNTFVATEFFLFSLNAPVRKPGAFLFQAIRRPQSGIAGVPLRI
jgi:hypothetical protein